jgi:CRISPR-associated protein Cmr3
LRDVVCFDDGGGVAVRTDQDLDLEGEIGRLGGDGRMVTFTRASAAADPAPPDRFPGTRLKVYLASPTWFEGGWRPSWIDLRTLTGEPPGVTARLRLVGAAITESPPIGGWDLKDQRPREMRRLVGAGAVYFFELVSGDIVTVASALHGRPFCDDPSMSGAGFGLAFVGSY